MSSMYLFSIDTIETDIPTYIFSTCYECSHVIIGIFEIWSSPKQQQQHKRKTMSTWWICCEKKFWHVHFALMIKVNWKNICTFFSSQICHRDAHRPKNQLKSQLNTTLGQEKIPSCLNHGFKPSERLPI